MTTAQRPLRIAVAEDNADARAALSAQLRALGHEVVCAVGDGAELLAHCLHQEIDLVIADLDMPVVDGLEAAEEVANRGVPVILLSGHPDVTRINLQHEPLAATLQKPASLASLRGAIEQAMAAGNSAAPPNAPKAAGQQPA
jgi:response regulator NasT